jgi:hypothetical protein
VTFGIATVFEVAKDYEGSERWRRWRKLSSEPTAGDCCERGTNRPLQAVQVPTSAIQEGRP